MGKKLLIIMLLIFVVGCSGQPVNQSIWYATESEAITRGIDGENLLMENIIGMEEVDGDTVVVFATDVSVSFAWIVESKEGYQWYRSELIYNINTESQPDDLSRFTLNTETLSGKEIFLIHGKIYDESIKRVRLNGDGKASEFEVNNRFGIYYFITTNELVSVEPIFNGRH